MFDHKLLSLWDMIRVHAHSLIQFGRAMQRLNNTLEKAPAGFMDEKVLESASDSLRAISGFCDTFGMSVTRRFIEGQIENPPETSQEWDMLFEVIRAELESKLFLHIETSRADYIGKQDLLSDSAQSAFPSAHNDLKEASNCYAFECYTASVFHSMRAAESGVRLFANDLSIDPKIVETQPWGFIQNQIQGAVKAIANQPRSTSRDADLEFYSQAATQLQYFNDGWRVRVAHTKAIYDQQQAVDALNHVCTFFESISSRIREIP